MFLKGRVRVLFLRGRTKEDEMCVLIRDDVRNALKSGDGRIVLTKEDKMRGLIKEGESNLTREDKRGQDACSYEGGCEVCSNEGGQDACS